METLNSRVWIEYFRLIPTRFATRYFLQLIARGNRGARIRSRPIKSPPQRLPKLADRFLQNKLTFGSAMKAAATVNIIVLMPCLFINTQLGLKCYHLMWTLSVSHFLLRVSETFYVCCRFCTKRTVLRCASTADDVCRDVGNKDCSFIKYCSGSSLHLLKCRSRNVYWKFYCLYN